MFGEDVDPADEPHSHPLVSRNLESSFSLSKCVCRGEPSCRPLVPGVILRDSHGVAQVRFVTGNKILRILKSKGLAPDLPEDLYHLIKKAVAVRKHLERNRKVKEPCQNQNQA